ncbi:MAG: T9SS type A sorting domain-containing protein [Bacteroidia bacterium]|nr:T9SS type A sorting domain-containing protein [Bacteroidia bacterium]
MLRKLLSIDFNIKPGSLKPAGEHKITLSTKELPAGIYFCKVAIGGKQKVFKLVKS